MLETVLLENTKVFRFHTFLSLLVLFHSISEEAASTIFTLLCYSWLHGIDYDKHGMYECIFVGINKRTFKRTRTHSHTLFPSSMWPHVFFRPSWAICSTSTGLFCSEASLSGSAQLWTGRASPVTSTPGDPPRPS